MKDFDTRDTTSRCATDAQLREAGFRIVARPKSGQPVWERNGVLFEQSEAERRSVKEQTT